MSKSTTAAACVFPRLRIFGLILIIFYAIEYKTIYILLALAQETNYNLKKKHPLTVFKSIFEIQNQLPLLLAQKHPKTMSHL